MTSPEQSSRNPSEDDEKAYRYVCRFMNRSEDYRDAYQDDWAKVLNLYSNTRNVKQNVLQRANLKVPYAFTVVETFTPQIVEAFLAEKPYIQAVGRGEEDIPFAKTLSDHLSYQLDQTDFLTRFTTFVKNTLLYGTGIAKVVWSVKDRNSKSVFSDPYFDGPEFQVINLEDFFPDWGSTIPGDIQSMRGCVHRVWRTLDELRVREKRDVNGEEVGIYHNLDELEESVTAFGNDAWENMSRTPDDRLSVLKDAKYKKTGMRTSDRIEIWEYWGIYDKYNDGTFYEYVITVANGDITIRCEENPLDGQYKPFLAAVDYPVAGEFYGTGEILPIISLCKEGEALRNARLDQVNQAVNRMWIADRNAGINVRSLYSRPNGIILTNDMNGLRPLDVPEVASSSFRETQQIDFDIQNVTAVTNPSQSVSNLGRAFGKTATGVNFMQGSTNSRLTLKVRLIEDSFMRKLGTMLMMLNKQFLKTSVWVRLYNGNSPYANLPPDAFSHQYDFYAVGAIDRLKRGEQQQIFQTVFVPYFQALEKSQPHSFNYDRMTKFMFDKFDMGDLAQVMNTPEERQKMQQQDQQAQQQAQMQQLMQQQQGQMQMMQQEAQSKTDLENTKSANKFGLQAFQSLFDAFIQGQTNASQSGNG